MKKMVFIILCILVTQAHAKDFIIGLDTTKTVNCTNATTRTDGSPLAASDIERVEFDITNGTDTYTIPMIGGCQPLSFDLTTLTAGTWDQVGRTYDADGRESVNSAAVPFGYVESTADPDPPVILE